MIWMSSGKHLLRDCLVAFLCFNIFVFVYMSNGTTRNHAANNMMQNETIDIRRNETLLSDEIEKSTCMKQIHIWSDRSTESRSKRQGVFPCAGLDCRIRIVNGKNFSLLQSSDALVFYQSTPWKWEDMYRHRPAGQIWIFYNWEAPSNTPRRVIPPAQFHNSTCDYIMTFRTGADRALYGSYGRYDTTTPEDEGAISKNWAANKTGTVIWVASHCHHPDGITWKRRDFVFGLSQHISVDTFGSCGKNKCQPDVKDCGIPNYKFYMAVENSECRDYITEKFWYNALHLDVVPVVYGPPKKDYEKVAPPHSFIHVQDFKSVSDLAAYLKLLDGNETLYNTYFHWKAKGSIVYNKEFSHLEPEIMCDNIVRRMLQDDNAMRQGTFKKAVMPHWKSWWTDSCHRGAGFPIKMD